MIYVFIPPCAQLEAERPKVHDMGGWYEVHWIDRSGFEWAKAFAVRADAVRHAFKLMLTENIFIPSSIAPSQAEVIARRYGVGVSQVEGVYDA